MTFAVRPPPPAPSPLATACPIRHAPPLLMMVFVIAATRDDGCHLVGRQWRMNWIDIK